MEETQQPSYFAASESGESAVTEKRGEENSCNQKETKVEEKNGSPSTGEGSRKRRSDTAFESLHKKARILACRMKLLEKAAKKKSRKKIRTPGPNLADLSDELLLQVLQSLLPRDLYSLSQVSTRFVDIVADHTLWVSPDFRHQHDLTCEQFCAQFMKYLGPWTHSVTTKGPLMTPDPPRLLPRTTDYLTPEFVEKLKSRCTNLKSLCLKEHKIDAKEIGISSLPCQLECLSIRRCGLLSLQTGESYFTGIHTTLPYLQELELNRCPWFYPHSLMSLSKCPHLKILRITQCPGIVDSLPYTSLSCRFGFKSLEILDLRQTHVGDPEMACFSQLQNLEELQLEKPGSAPPPVEVNFNSSDSEDSVPGNCSEEQYVRCQCGDILPEGSSCGNPCFGGAACGCWGTGGRCSPPPDVDHHHHHHHHHHPHTSRNHDRAHVINYPGRHSGVNCVDWSPSLLESVSDTGLCSLGSGSRAAPGVVVVRMVGATTGEHNPRLKKIVARGYSYVTDISVRYLALVPTLRYLDLSGCGVTRRGLESFAAIRPEVVVKGLQRKKTEWDEYRDQIMGTGVQKNTDLSEDEIDVQEEMS